MALLDNLFDNNPKPSGGAINPKWATDSRGRFHRLADLDPDRLGLSGTSAVFVLWHKGVKPAWVYVGRSRNLAETLYDIGKNDEIMHNDLHGGLYVTWSLIRNEFQDGVVRYLTNVLQPKIPNTATPGVKTKPIAVLIPGVKG